MHSLCSPALFAVHWRALAGWLALFEAGPGPGRGTRQRARPAPAVVLIQIVEHLHEEFAVSGRGLIAS